VNAAYTYNGDGLRVGQTLNGQGTTFTWDVAAALPQVLATSDGAAYLYGLGLLAQQSGAWQYPLPDGLGSLRQWTDVGGQVTYAARYAPFGALLWQQGTAPAPWGFAGEMQDPTGLIYLRARWYDPATSRFLTRDPFPGLVMLPSTQHPYVYALNNPVLYTDPSGEFIVPLLLAAAIGGGFAAYSYFQAQPCATFPSALSDPAFQRAVGIGMLAGAVGGLIGFGVGAIGVGAFGGGLSGAIISGAVGGGLAGGVGEALRQVATYGHIRNPQLLGAAMLSGVVTGGVLGAVGYGVRQLLANRIGPISPPTRHRGLRNAMSPPPSGMTNPQAHHDLPWEFRDWFAGPRRGLNVNDPRFGQWVEGTPPGLHQNWTRAYSDAWRTFIENNPTADRWQVMAFLRRLLSSGRFQ
jgi:RHS repeat-associated protein